MNNEKLCGQCLQCRPIYNKTISAFYYANPIDNLVTQFKFHHNLAYGKILSQLLTEKLLYHYQNQPKPELIIPVPLHRKRLIERGYNQAIELAKPIAQQLKIKLTKTTVKRIKHTARQSDLALKNRAKNLRNAFQLTKPLTKYQHIALIDDVITTSQTIQSLAKSILKQHPLIIDVWCIARTDIKNN
jgi:ComF family protein